MILQNLDNLILDLMKFGIAFMGIGIIYTIIVLLVASLYFLWVKLKKRKVQYIELNIIIICKIIQNIIFIIYNVHIFNRVLGGIGGDWDILSFLFFSFLLSMMYIPISIIISFLFVDTFKPNHMIIWFVTTIPYVDLIMLIFLKCKFIKIIKNQVSLK